MRRTLACFTFAALAPNETNNIDHGKRVDMCTRGVADEHDSDVDANGNDMFKRRLACARHLAEQPALAAWEAMKDCESRTLFLD